MNITDCECCHGDEPVAEDNNSILFIDNTGHITVYDKSDNVVLKGKVYFCPRCGRNFESNNS